MKLSHGDEPACLLDASIFIFRYYFSLPDRWWSSEGYGTGAVYGYTGFLLHLLTEQRPRLIAACFDESLTTCFRNQLYPAYKSSRELPDEALAFQLQACRRVTELLGIATLASASFEADDLIGALMRQLHQQQPEVTVAILTRDKDLGQLLSRPQDCLWDYLAGAGVGEGRMVRQQIRDRFGVWPEQLPDYLALVGDKIDDIPGVPGIGPKTASQLLQRFDNLDQLYRSLDEIPALALRGAQKLPQRLRQHHVQAQLARQLATIVTDPAVLDGHQHLSLNWCTPDVTAFASFCDAMGFGGSYQQRLQRILEAA